MITVKAEEDFKVMLSDFRGAPAVRLQLARRRSGHKATAIDPSATAILETVINPVVLINSVC